MAEIPRPPSVPPPTNPDGSVHGHSNEIERSRVRAPSTDRPGSAAGSGAPLPPVSRPGSSTGGPGRPGSSSARPVSGRASVTGSVDDPPVVLQMSKKDPLPPITAKDDSDIEDLEQSSSHVPEVTSEIIANTMAGGGQGRSRGANFKNPRVLSYRPEMDMDSDAANLDSVTKTVSEKRTVKLKDGSEMVVKSIDCQTEWSWLKDMELVQRLSTTPGDRPSRTSNIRPPTQTPSGFDADEEEEGELDLEAAKSSKTAPSRASERKTSERKASRAASELSQGTKSQRSHRSKGDPHQTTPAGDAEPETPGVQPGYTDDTYGIPILELSSDSDSSDEEMFNEDKYKATAAAAAAAEASNENETIPSVGPPQILQYQRESEKKSARLEEETKGGECTDSIFQGQCEFCGASIKPFPTLEEQVNTAPNELYCCDDYREFLQFMLSQHVPPEQEKLIDITPHPPHGSKQARRAAKERAAQRFFQRMSRQQRKPGKKPRHVYHVPELSQKPPRLEKQSAMRERQIQRQQNAMVGGFGGGGGGGGGGASSFYQSQTGPQGHRLSSMHSKILDRKEERHTDSAQLQLARQMKTINYQLSSQKCLEEGWTLRPPSPMLDQEPEPDVFEPQPILPSWAEGASKDRKEAGLVQKFYPDGSKFVILFPDGTGNAFYPSGRVAVTISSVEKGLYTYLAHADHDEDPNVLAVFDPDGHATSYHSNNMVRICLDPMGGLELDQRGCRKRKWSWKDQVDHVHAPPIQPITFAVTPHLSVRITGQENITLTFNHSSKSCRFQVGARLKLVCKESVHPPEIDEELIFREEVKNRIQTLFSKVSNLLKFPKSPKLDKLPGPSHVTSRQEKIDRARQSYGGRSAKGEKEKKESPPVITVN